MQKQSKNKIVGSKLPELLYGIFKEPILQRGLSGFLETQDEMIFIIDKSDKIAYLNDFAAKQFNTSVENVIGKERSSLFPPKVAETQSEALKRVYNNGEPIYEETLTGFPGNEIYLGTKLIPLKNDEGKINFVLGISKDLTSQKNTEEIVLRDEKLLQTIINNSPVVIFAVDNNGVFTYSDGKGLEALNLEPGEAVGRSLYEMFGSSEGVIENFEFALKGKSVSFTSTIGQNTFEAYYSPQKNKTGEITGIIGIGIDITDKRKSEDKIQLLTTALESAANGIVITNLSGDIIWVNKAFTTLTGYSLGEVENKNVNLLKSGVHDHSFYKDLWTTILSGKVWHGEIINKKKDGSQYTEEQTITPVKNELGQISHFIAIKQDITEKKSVEKRVIEAKEKAEKSDQLKTHFLAQMSHEIRTPINSILNFTNLIKHEIEDNLDDELKDAIQIIESEGKRITRTIELMLNMSEIQTGTYEPKATECDIWKDVLHEIKKEYQGIISQKGLDISFCKETDNTKLKTDNYAVYQIFVNLVDNAVKYTHQGGITITAKRNMKNQLIVLVDDTGIGIAEEYLPNLFELFTQEDIGYTRSYEGNGLGLALVKRYCDLNNIEIGVESKKGEGTKFKLLFPSLK